MIVNLCHGNQSIKSLLSYAHRPANQGLLSARLLEDLGLVFPRESRRLIEKLRPVRNALVHYDFRQFPESEVSGNEHADYDIINVLKRLTGMTLSQRSGRRCCLQANGRSYGGWRLVMGQALSRRPVRRCSV